MSKGSRVLDAERTATMLDLVRRDYEGDLPENQMSRSWVVLEEVAPATGWAANRWADVLALGIWKSTERKLHGYEIKASRADLKKELSDPSKHQALARFCDTWTLVAWDDRVTKDLDIPEAWGVWLTKVDAHDCRVLDKVKRPEKLTPEPFTRDFVCSLVRNAYEQSPGAAYVARALDHLRERLREEYRRQRKTHLRESIEALGKALYPGRYWGSSYEPEEVIKLAVQRLTQPLLAKEGA